jgi:glycerol-3-phosphate acyltransferase PlsX
MDSAGEKRVTVCVDAMGGDSAPEYIVDGAVSHARCTPEIAIVLTGHEERIRAEFVRLGVPQDFLPIHHATECVGMGEGGAKAVRRKKDSSLSVAARLMQEGVADALVSAGNTGAVVSTALLGLGRIPGIQRPAIASVMPTQHGRCVVLDVGATVDCRPEYLAQFAILGALYSQEVVGVPTPRVGLLNVGEEPGKGNDLVRAAHPLIAELPINFVGNIEGRDVLRGAADVVVCDGFTGNVLLKFAESFKETFRTLLARELRSLPLARLGVGLARPAFRRLFQRLDYAEYGGAPLLGVKGGCIICHGASSERAIHNAIRMAATQVVKGLNAKVADMLEKGEVHGRG